jgi:hypothetical protein
VVARLYYTYDPVDLPADPGGDHPWTDGPAPGVAGGFELARTKDARHASMEPLTAPVPAGAFDVLLGAWYSPPLRAQELAGTAAGLIPLTMSPGVTAVPDMRIALVDADGAVRSWLYTGVTDGTGAPDQFPPAVADAPAQLSPASAQKGDRLRIDLGVLGSSSEGGTVTLGLTARLGVDIGSAPPSGPPIGHLPTVDELRARSLVADPDHPGLFFDGEGATVLTEDPEHPGLYLIGT